MNKIIIHRLDYKNPNKMGLPVLKHLDNINDITDINEVLAIGITFDSDEQAKKFVSNFPKYFKLRIGKEYGQNTTYNYTEFEKGLKAYVGIQFNTFWTNKVTGKANETAIKKREKYIEILKRVLKN